MDTFNKKLRAQLKEQYKFASIEIKLSIEQNFPEWFPKTRECVLLARKRVAQSLKAIKLNTFVY